MKPDRRSMIKMLLSFPLITIPVGGAAMNALKANRLSRKLVIDYDHAVRSKPMIISLISVWMNEKIADLQKASIAGDEDNVIDAAFSVLSLSILLIGVSLQKAAKTAAAQWLLSHTKDFQRIPFWMRMVPVTFDDFTYNDVDNSEAMNALESKFYNDRSLLDREEIMR